MPDTLFISYKSEENPFALKLAAGLKNRGINVWIDHMDIHPGDDWDETIDHALKHLCRGMIVILTPDYLKSRVCHDEWSYAVEKNLPVIPVLLRRLNEDEIHFRLRRIQRLDFLDWLDERAYQAKFELLVERIQRDQSDTIGDVPSAEIQYLTSLIADLESQQGVENYIALSAQSEVVRIDPRPRKNVEPSLVLLLKPFTPEHDSLPETKKIDNIQQAVTDHNKFVLIGDPGAGKTTTLRRLALEMAQKRLEALKSGDTTPPLPFIAYLPRWADEPTAADFIRRQWSQTNMGGDVGRELQSGQVRLYLDGLNEMGGKGKNKAVLLREWLQSADGARHVIITCRQADYHDDLDLKLPTVLVEPLTDDQIREFAVQYLSKEQAGPFLEKLPLPDFILRWQHEETERRSLIHLARNPYLLAALALIFEAGGDLPRNTGALFHKLVMVLWERERLRQTSGWIPFDEMQVAFGNLAFNMIDEDQPIDVPLNYAEIKLGNADLLGVGRSANLIIINGDEMRFSHQLMLEYFAAAGLSMVGLATRLQITLPVRQRTTSRDIRPSTVFGLPTRQRNLPFRSIPSNRKWGNVVVALCGLVSDASSVVTQVVGIDPFLAADCLVSGIEVNALAHERVTSRLLEVLRYPNEKVRATAAEALIKIMVRATVAEALIKIGTTALPNLLEALHDTDPVVRNCAVYALHVISDPTTVPNLLETLHDTYVFVRVSVIIALGDIADPATISALIDYLADTADFGASIMVADVAAEALEKIGTPEALEAVRRWHDNPLPFYLKGLSANDYNTRQGAARALGKIGTTAVPSLLVALGDSVHFVRAEAARALGEIGDLSTVPNMLEALHDTSPEVRAEATKALRKIGTAALPNLLMTLRNSRPDVRSRVVSVLGDIGDPVAVPRLIELLVDTEQGKAGYSLFEKVGRVCDFAAEALEKIGTPEALEAVRRWREEQNVSDIVPPPRPYFKPRK